jgi:hypothetical protein
MIGRGEAEKVKALLGRGGLSQEELAMLQVEAILLINFPFTLYTHLSIETRVDMLCELIRLGPDLEPDQIDELLGSWHLYENPAQREAVLNALAPQLVARELSSPTKEEM